MNTIVINVNGTILNLTVKRGATVSVTIKDDVEEIVEEEIVCELVDIEEEEKEIVEEEVVDEISLISLQDEAENSDSDSAYEYVEMCKPVCKPVHKSAKSHHIYTKDEDGNYICPYCNIVKKKCNTMSEHVRQKHSSEYGRKTDMYVCRYDNCKMSFTVKPGLDQHIANRHSEKYIKCPFPNCDYNGAKNDSTIVSHYARNHMDYNNLYKKEDGVSTCNNCNFSCKPSISYHLGRCYKTSPFYKKNNK